MTDGTNAQANLTERRLMKIARSSFIVAVGLGAISAYQHVQMRTVLGTFQAEVDTTDVALHGPDAMFSTIYQVGLYSSAVAFCVSVIALIGVFGTFAKREIGRRTLVLVFRGTSVFLLLYWVWFSFAAWSAGLNRISPAALAIYAVASLAIIIIVKILHRVTAFLGAADTIALFKQDA